MIIFFERLFSIKSIAYNRIKAYHGLQRFLTSPGAMDARPNCDTIVNPESGLIARAQFAMDALQRQQPMKCLDSTTDLLSGNGTLVPASGQRQTQASLARILLTT